MYKKMKLLVSMLAAAAVLVLLPGRGVMTVKAEEPKTYSIKFIGGNINDWRYMPGSTFEDGKESKKIYYLLTYDLKDGDHIVIYPGDTAPNQELHLDDFKLGSLTIHRNANVVIFTAGITDCYVLAGAYTAINGEVSNAQLYDTVTCTFNSNVLDLVLHIGDEPHSGISCAGTVGMFQLLKDPDDIKGTFYDIPKNTMRYIDGTIQFPNWSYNPSEAYLQAKNAASGATAASESAAAAAPAGDASSEYDKVPKTGDNSLTPWLIGLAGAAAALFAGSYGLYRKTN
ncbi:MAG: hypothetical protein NC123_01610 [Butyrivibrio sp.]|nr:hypothetical protein [Acetatifactor muris]MCM1558235.1 hypothetical protein [Butyrivibrio sp.]